MKVIGKISAKSVVGKVPTQDARVPLVENGEVVTKDGEPVYKTVQRGIRQNLMRVFGQCDNVKPITTQYGTSIEFQGNFEATNAITGEVFRSTKLFLPDIIEGLVHSEVQAALEASDNGKAGVQFAFDIGADSANNAHGYQYTITPLTKPTAADPLEAMRAQLLGNVAPLQLANAPTATAETQAEPATAGDTPAETAAETKGSKSKSK
jgi:hypothetical protein